MFTWPRLIYVCHRRAQLSLVEFSLSCVCLQHLGAFLNEKRDVVDESNSMLAAVSSEQPAVAA